MTVSPQLDEIIHYLYHDILDDYWPEELKYVENGYNHLEFPLTEINTATTFNMKTNWSLTSLIGYLNTWSAVKRYRENYSAEPVDRILPDLKAIWGNEKQEKSISWPLHLRIGKKIKGAILI